MPQEESSRSRLRTAAKALFAQRGYEATAISDITRAARTSHSQFLKYYSGKRELRREIIDEQWAELTRAIVLASISVPSPSDKLRLVLNMLISFLEGDPQFRAILLFEHAVGREHGIVRTSDAFREFVEFLDEIVAAMASAGQLQAGVDSEALRSALLGAVEGMMRDQLLAAGDFPAHYSIAQIRSMLSQLIDSACDVQRPSLEAPVSPPGTRAEAGIVAEDEWIRYYLKLADRALRPADVS